MNITEFAAARHIEAQAVSKYISRHPEEFKGLISRVGKEVILSDGAVYLLEKKYPLPKPIEVVVDHQSRDELIKVQREVIRLQQELHEQTQLIAEAKYNQLLLEKRDAEVQQLTEKISERDAELKDQDVLIEEQKAQLQAADDEKSALQAQVEELKANLQAEQEKVREIEAAGLFKRIFKSWNKRN